jgi:hypothetical protein
MKSRRIIIHMKTTVFWVFTPCNLVEVYRCFRGVCCLHYQGDLTDYTAQQPRRQPSSYSPPWEPEISDTHFVILLSGKDKLQCNFNVIISVTCALKMPLNEYYSTAKLFTDAVSTEEEWYRKIVTMLRNYEFRKVSWLVSRCVLFYRNTSLLRLHC